MRIDSHQHFWETARGDYGWLTPDLTVLYRDFVPADLAPLLRKCKIDRTVLVQAAPTAAETQFLLQVARATDFVAGVVGWVDLAAADAPDTIDRLAADPLLRGIRPMLQDLPDVEWILRRELSPAIEAVIAADLRFDALVRPAHLPALLHLLERHPDLRVVVDHGAKPNIAQSELEPWAAAMRTIAKTTPATCKVSGLLTEAAPGAGLDALRPYLDCLFESFGPDRLMWGSDWPVVTLACGYRQWWSLASQYLARCSAIERHAVLGGTAAAFYGIE